MKRRVLAVDDEQSIRAAVEMSFEDAGWEVATAASAEEALGILREQSFDILFLDKNLPGISGLDLLRKVREENRDVAVVLMTAFGSASSAKEGLELGVDRYLEKPFADVFDLARVADELLSRGRRKWIPDANVFGGAPGVAPDGDRPLRVAVLSKDDALRGEIAQRLAAFRGVMAGEEAADLVVFEAERLTGEFLTGMEGVRKRTPDAWFAIVTNEDPPLDALKKMIEIGVAGLLPRRFDESFTKRFGDLLRAVRTR